MTVSDGFQHATRWLEKLGVRVPGEVAVANLDLREGSGEAGMAQNLAEEGWAAVDLLSSHVERARFGLPAVARTVLVPGAWRDGWSEGSCTTSTVTGMSTGA